METPGTYQPRLADVLLEKALRSSGAVVLEGPKWCGKTWTGMRHATSAVWVADPTNDYLTHRIGQTDPFSLLTGEQPVLIDEWQDAPGLWDAVRMSIDRQPGTGRYLLTGSATPRDGVVSHSGTGRIARLRMWPMTLAESGRSSSDVSLADLLDGRTPATKTSQWTEPDLVEAIVRGGWPGSLGMPLPDAAQVPVNYLDSVSHSDASKIDGVRRDPGRLSALLASLSRTTSTLVTNRTLVRDMAASAGEDVSTKTIAAYIDVLRRLHVLVEIPAWAPALRSPVRLRNSPKRLLCDPSLAAAGLHATAETITNDRKTFGLLFETMCLRDLSVYAQASSAHVFHYRDESELEVDAIIQTSTGQWSAVEIKLGSDQENSAASSLLALDKKMTSAGEKPASALIVLTGPGSFSHRRSDGVIVVPVDVLGP
jgi:predicted AAA+ superfamily ATPase